MAEPFLAEIRLMSFNFAPRGWAQCNGQLLPINQNQALFSLLGTTYGGDGRVNFALPNFRGRVPLHFGNGFTQGEAAGEYAHTVTISEMPQHNHLVGVSSSATSLDNPTGALLSRASVNAYGPLNNAAPMAAQVVGNTGGSQPHQNTQPYLTINFSIALQGIFPSPN